MTIQIGLINGCDVALMGMQAVIAADHRLRVATAQTDLAALRLCPPALDVVIVAEDADQGDAFTILDILRQMLPDTRYVLVGRCTDGALLRDLLLVGLHGYLYTYDPLGVCLIHAIDRVMRGRPYLSPTADSEYLLTMQSGKTVWTPDAEARTILRMLASGYSVGGIAYALGVRPRHVYSIREKLRRRFAAQSNEHLITRAIEEGYRFTGEL